MPREDADSASSWKCDVSRIINPSDLVCATLGVVILWRRKQMADPKDEKIEKKAEEQVASDDAVELSEADVEKVAGGIVATPCCPGSSRVDK